MADDRMVIFPIMESKFREIKNWCNKNTPGYIMKLVSRPYEYETVAPRDYKAKEYAGYDFYLFAFNSIEELSLFKLIYLYNESE